MWRDESHKLHLLNQQKSWLTLILKLPMRQQTVKEKLCLIFHML